MTKKASTEERTQVVSLPSSSRNTSCQIGKLCRLGATDEEIAAFFGQSINTIDHWKREHLEFLRTLKEGKASSDRESLRGFICGRWVEDEAVDTEATETHDDNNERVVS